MPTNALILKMHGATIKIIVYYHSFLPLGISLIKHTFQQMHIKYVYTYVICIY